MPRSPTSPAAREEDALVDAARGGDASAFRLLVDAHAARVHGIARRMVRDPHDAEEVAQDAFVRAWRALPYFRGDAAFTTWLHRIVVRLAYDRLRQTAARRRREIPAEGEVVSRFAARVPAGAEGVHRDVDWDAMLETLPPTARAAIVLFYWHDRSVREVAEVLELPEGTVKSHLARARTSMRETYLRAKRRETHDAP